MKRGLMFLIVTTCAIVVLAYGVRGNAQHPSAAASGPAAAANQAVLSKYCYTCHNDRVTSGGLALTALDISATAIRRPLLVVQGLNDPRVPASESEQMVYKLRANGAEVWYLAAKDEGHGFRRKANRDAMLAAVVQFLGKLK